MNSVIFLIVLATIAPNISVAQDATQLGRCYTGTHCNCQPSKSLLTREACAAALDDEGLFGVGSWRGVNSKVCEKIGTNSEYPDNCND